MHTQPSHQRATPSSDPSRSRGRPRLASRALLEEAAFELFLEQGFTHTTVDDISLRAGVSRNTFFNYFAAKADVFWVDIDRALDALPQHLSTTDDTTPVIQAIGEAFADCAADLGENTVPWILTNFEAIGQPDELMESALRRFAATASILKSFAAERLEVSERDLLPQVLANTTLAATTSAAIAWGAAGVQRGKLQNYLLRALAPLAEGFKLSR